MTTTLDAELLALQEVCRGRFAIERELGRGGMGVVVLARDLALDRPVAVKLLPAHFARQPELRERFLREARVAAGLSHPNIVPIHTVEEHGDVVFFVMGYVDGETLARRVARAGPLPPAEAARLIQEVAWALAYAHGRGIVHRDVKPDNILVERATGRALVTDFGIARVAAATRALTVDGHVMGTAQFMSPEQAAGEPVDGRSDIYALGVVAYHALTGALPFEAESLTALLAMQVTQPAPPLASRRPDVPPRLARAVDRCLAKRPEDRFDSAEALAAALADVETRGPDVAPQVRTFQRVAEQTGLTLWMFVIFAAVMAPSATRTQRGAILGAVLGALMSAVDLLRRARELLRDGFTAADVRAAFAAELESRERDLAAVRPEVVARRKRMRRILIAVAVVVGAAAVATVVTATNLPRGTPLRQALRWVFLVEMAIATACAAIASNTNPRTERRSLSWMARPWRGRFTDWFFRLAAVGLRPEGGAAAAPAAPALEIPTPVRRRFADLPALVERIDPALAALRRREEEVERALAEAGADRLLPEPAHALARGNGADEEAPGVTTQAMLLQRRLALVADLRGALAAARQRRTDLVAAGENVRIGVARLRAGVGTADDLAPDVEALRALVADVK